jgi:dihydrodipicolinate synthase/N-acetylneuraminate lyase
MARMKKDFTDKVEFLIFVGTEKLLLASVSLGVAAFVSA